MGRSSEWLESEYANKMAQQCGTRGFRISTVGQNGSTVAAVFASDPFKAHQPDGDSAAWYLTPGTTHDNEKWHRRDVDE